jgi:hypothetical protein
MRSEVLQSIEQIDERIATIGGYIRF